MKNRTVFAVITAILILLSIFIENYDVSSFVPEYDKNDTTDTYANILESLRKLDKGDESRYTADGITRLTATPNTTQVPIKAEEE